LETNTVEELASGEKKLGILIRDTISGIGTVTYVDKTTQTFAALGHPVLDKNNQMIELNGGAIYGCVIYDVKQGLRGMPGELHGIFENDNMIGQATLNCRSGVYGNVSAETDYNRLQKIYAGKLEDVKIGKAEIYTTIEGTERQAYQISIIKVENNRDNRDFVIRIDDERLKEKTGGIVQGMSGSPIVQNGKLVGAITHVFVNDPTRGYGIAVEKMLQS
jgi:stage IV sporulation protein B